MQAPLIELDAVTRVYGEGDATVHALRGVSLSIARGEFVAVMGPSGSGKSTCMNLIGCLDVPTSGAYRFEGLDLTKLASDQRALFRRLYLGFVFQGFNLLARTSALENVELPLIYRRLPRRERRERALATLATVGLQGRERHTAAELSGGQVQRVAIARAIVGDPSLLLADEPTGNLDRARTREVMELLQRLNAERGITIVMVTHDEETAKYAHRIVRFVDGLVASDSRAAEAA